MPIFALAYIRSLHLLQSEKDLPSMMSKWIYVVVLDLGRHFWLHPKQNGFELKANKFKKKKKNHAIREEQIFHQIVQRLIFSQSAVWNTQRQGITLKAPGQLMDTHRFLHFILGITEGCIQAAQ